MENQDEIFSQLRNAGASVAGACGVMGNIEIESGGNPEAYNPNEDAIGLCQWEGGRKTELEAYAAHYGGSSTDLHIQIGFLIEEAKARGNWQAVTEATDAAACAAYWDANFEVSAGTARNLRMQVAASFFAYYGDASHDAPAPAPAGDTYTVKPGDTLSGIATAHGLDWQTLYDANRAVIGDNPDLIYPGQVLSLAVGPVANPAPTPAPEPTPEPPAPGQVATFTPYAVQPGDTLSEIGARFNVDYHVIAADNGIENPDYIQAGWTLHIRNGAPAPVPANVSYTVQPGDTLSGIAAAHGIDWHDLYNRNRAVIGDNPDLIYPGQVYVIP